MKYKNECVQSDMISDFITAARAFETKVKLWNWFRVFAPVSLFVDNQHTKYGLKTFKLLCRNWFTGKTSSIQFECATLDEEPNKEAGYMILAPDGFYGWIFEKEMKEIEKKYAREISLP